MKSQPVLRRFLSLLGRNALVAVALSFVVGCVDPVTSEADALAAADAASPSNPAPRKQPAPRLDKHDVALRFLTAFVRLDREMALKFATPEAVSALDWNRPHRGNIPYYDDKMILHYNGGWARIYFQQVDGSYRISKIKAHSR